MSISITREYGVLIPILERMRVPRHGVLVVHGAIATLSRQGFRAEAMIEALFDYMGTGTLVMPTMSWRAVTPEQPTWDEIETRSETGVMTEIFRTRYASRRSIHPTHSVAAWRGRRYAGCAASSRRHAVSANSPYGLMRETRAYVLFLGVGLEACTAIHLPEETIAPDIYLRPTEEAAIYQCRDRDGVVHQVRARRHWRLDRDFPKFGPPLQRTGVMHFGNIGGCPYAVVALADLLDLVFAVVSADPRGTLRSQSFAPTEN